MSEEEPGYTVIDRRFDSGPEGAEQAQTSERKPSYVMELEAKLKQRDEDLIAVRARHVRAVQEFEDAKARMRRDIGQEIERGKQAILADLVEVVDNLDRAIEAARQKGDDGPLLRGVEVARDQFLSKLRNYGVERIDPSGRFDPELHEAVATVPTADPQQAGRIAGVIRPAYKIGDKVIRPATVAVHSASTQPEAS
jgi:molecular chaperone GrpE